MNLFKIIFFNILNIIFLSSLSIPINNIIKDDNNIIHKDFRIKDRLKFGIITIMHHDENIAKIVVFITGIITFFKY